MEHITNDLNPDDPEPSVAKVVDTVSGYPEIKYWKDEYLCNQISDQNKPLFCGEGVVEFYDDPGNSTSNFEYLFNLTSGGDKYLDPEESSLFNVQTLKLLIKTGEQSVNIIDQKDTSYADAISTNIAHWDALSTKLRFCDQQQTCDNKRTYLIYLWIDTLIKQTFQRQQDGGNLELGVLPTLGQAAFEQNMDLMHLEFPIIVYGSLLQNYTSGQYCGPFFTTYGFSQ